MKLPLVNQLRAFGGKTLLAVMLSLSLLLSSCSALEEMFSPPAPAETTQEATAAAPTDVAIPTEAENTSERPRNTSVVDASTRQDVKDGVKPLSTMEIAAKASPTVVAISTTGVTRTPFGSRDFQGAGSGVIISEDGYIVTNNHVIRDAASVDVVLPNGENYTASLIGTAPNNDLAVIKIEQTGLPFATIGNSDDLIVGELAVAVGNPLGDFQGTVTTGIISSLGRTLVLADRGDSSTLIELRNLIQTDAAINSGNSGGGLFNSYGELIGINVAKAGAGSQSNASVEGLGFAIPTNTATPIINALVNEGHVSGEPSLGIWGSDVTAQMAESYAGQLVPGVWIREIAPGSPVLDAGMQVGDVIVEFAGEEVVSVAQLNLVKNRYRAGDTVDVRYYRDGTHHETRVVLAEQDS